VPVRLKIFVFYTAWTDPADSHENDRQDRLKGQPLTSSRLRDQAFDA
jgi:hypothetical protein